MGVPVKLHKREREAVEEAVGLVGAWNYRESESCAGQRRKSVGTPATKGSQRIAASRLPAVGSFQRRRSSHLRVRPSSEGGG